MVASSTSPADAGGGNMILCVALATFTGCTYMAGVAATALPTFLIERKGKQVTAGQSLCMTVVYVALMGIANGPLIYATSQGPVAVVVPVAIGTYMLTNMLLQVLSGMSYYTKGMRIGTLVLALASMMLIEDGPSAATGDEDAIAMLKATSSIVWLSIVGVVVIGGCVGILLTRSKAPGNFAKIISYTLVVGFQAALNNTLSKLMSCTEGNLQYGVTAAFVLGSVISGGFSAMACTATDSAVSVPLMSCVQVLVNGMSGIFIWGDLPRISKPISYTFVYIYFFLGIYLTSTADLGANLVRWSKYHKEKNITTQPCKGEHGKKAQDLYKVVKRGVEGTAQEDDIIKAFEAYFQNARAHHMETHEFDRLATETMKTASQHGGDKEVAYALARWLATGSDNFAYLMSCDPELAEDVRALAKQVGCTPRVATPNRKPLPPPGSDLSQPLL